MALVTYSPPTDRIVHTTQVDFIDRSRLGTPVHLVQGDKSLPIVAVEMYKNGQPYAAPAGALGNVRWKKPNPDAHYVYNNLLGVNSDRTIAYFEVTAQMTTKDGPVHAVLEIVVGANSANSGPLPILLDRNPVQDGDMESTEELKALQQYVSDAQTAADNAKKSENAASGSATKAASSESSARSSASAASGSAAAAARSESNARDSATAASGSADKAAASEKAAQKAATDASASASKAATSEKSALTSKEAAAKSEANAKTSEDRASASERYSESVANSVAAIEQNIVDISKIALEYLSYYPMLSEIFEFIDQLKAYESEDYIQDHDGKNVLDFYGYEVIASYSGFFAFFHVFNELVRQVEINRIDIKTLFEMFDSLKANRQTYTVYSDLMDRSGEGVTDSQSRAISGRIVYISS